jgi:hypothetical protein
MYIYACIYICIRAHKHTYICIYMYIYINTKTGAIRAVGKQMGIKIYICIFQYQYICIYNCIKMQAKKAMNE